MNRQSINISLTIDERDQIDRATARIEGLSSLADAALTGRRDVTSIVDGLREVLISIEEDAFAIQTTFKEADKRRQDGEQ